MKYIAVFFTHSGAVKYNRFLVKSGMCSEMMPVPRKLSSNCGIGVKFSYEGDISSIVTEEIEKIFLMEDNTHKEIYSCE
ncbi:DUF3343 domain-containing protein [Clostridium sp. KNHs214]|uniref:DUF3343 domain-containing protein n=1 Tax=Clostridium sp. KNHs214 TaxID=1540257 RepID=UPI00055140BC|nr:DUF3343 domain-containing protein [Clostridium sp. KNHs214]